MTFQEQWLSRLNIPDGFFVVDRGNGAGTSADDTGPYWILLGRDVSGSGLVSDDRAFICSGSDDASAQ